MTCPDPHELGLNSTRGGFSTDKEDPKQKTSGTRANGARVLVGKFEFEEKFGTLVSFHVTKVVRSPF